MQIDTSTVPGVPVDLLYNVLKEIGYDMVVIGKKEEEVGKGE